jgi:hypothetical protein
VEHCGRNFDLSVYPECLSSLASSDLASDAADVPAASAERLREFGEIDIHLFDELLRGRFDRRRRLLDGLCGAGRNLTYFSTAALIEKKSWP